MDDEKGGERLGLGTRSVRMIYSLFAWLFVACVAVQVFLAGLGTFGAMENWGRHVSFVHFFEFLPIVLFTLAFVGRLKRGLRWWPPVLFILIGFQYVTAHLGTVMVAALHPINAIIISGIAVMIAWQSLRSAFKS